METNTKSRSKAKSGKRKRSKGPTSKKHSARCCDRETAIVDLRRELDDVTDRLIVSRLQRTELEKAVQTANDRIEELEATLEGRVSALWADGDRADAGAELDDSDNVYVFDRNDSVGEAFDAFFAEPDPHLDKVRNFLLG